MRKMQNSKCNIRHFDGFFFIRNEFGCTGTQSHRFWKWICILNWNEWILLVNIPTQILLTIFLSMDHSLRLIKKVCIISQTKEKPYTTKNCFFCFCFCFFFVSQNYRQDNKSQESVKAWIWMSTTNIFMLQSKIYKKSKLKVTCKK